MPLRQLFPDPHKPGGSCRVDIIAVPGLNTQGKALLEHAWDTWRPTDRPNDRFWLRDDLPVCTPDARILLYEYDARVGPGKGRMKFAQDAITLLEEIILARADFDTRPLLFLGHHIGGLLVKKALIRASREPKFSSIKEATTGLVFFATPHSRTETLFDKRLALETLFSGYVEEHWDNQILTPRCEVVSFLGSQDGVSDLRSEFFSSARLGLPDGRERVVELDGNHNTICKFGFSPIDIHNLDIVRKNIQALYEKVVWSSPLGTRANSLRSLGAVLMEVKSSSHPQAGHLTATQPVARHPVYHLPFPRNKRFVGREDILMRLRDLLFFQGIQTVALVGLGGIGKSQAALELAYWVKGNLPDFSIFWVSALSEAAFGIAFGEIANKFGLRTGEGQDIRDSVKDHLSSEAAGRWLLIVDNADDMRIVSSTYGMPDHLDSFLPTSDQGRTLFTSRSYDVAHTVAEEVVSLTEMALEEAKWLLETSLTRQHPMSDERIAEELLRRLVFHPLAITQAISYMARNRITTREYLRLFHNTEDDRIDLLSLGLPDKTRYQGSHNAVASTMHMSFEQIQETDSHAAELLRFISQIEAGSIPQSLLPRPSSELQMINAIGTLRAYSFLSKDEMDMLHMHPLVHIATKAWVKREEEHENGAGGVTERAIRHLAKVFPTADYADYERRKAYIPHALRLLRAGGGPELKERSELAYWVGLGLAFDGWERESVRWLEECFEWSKTQYGEDHPDRQEPQRELARAYICDDQVKKAIRLLDDLIQLEEKSLPEHHPTRLKSTRLRAVAYRANGQIRKSIETLESVVALEARIPATSDSPRLRSLYELAVGYRSNGQIARAVELLEYVTAIQERTLASDHPFFLSAQCELATAYRARGQVGRSIHLLKQQVDRLDPSLKEQHPYQLRAMHELALSYEGTGQHLQAMNILEHAWLTARWIRKHTALDGTTIWLPIAQALATSCRSAGDPNRAAEIEMKITRHSEPFAEQDSDLPALQCETGAKKKLGSELDDFDAEPSVDQTHSGSIFATGVLPKVPALTTLSITIRNRAREEMVGIFLDDQELRPLFQAAIESQEIGGSKFETVFRRLLQEFSKDLRAATDVPMYHDTADFLQQNAHSISQEIRYKFEPKPETLGPSSSETTRSSKVDTDEAKQDFNERLEISRPRPSSIPLTGGTEPVQDVGDVSQEDLEPADDEMIQPPPADKIKEFLISGYPIQNLRKKLRTFVMPHQLIKSEDDLTGRPSLPDTYFASVFPGSLPELVDRVFDLCHLTSMEPPIPPGKSRVRWTCRCGARLYDDYTELDPGSLKDLQTELYGMNSSDPQASQHNQPQSFMKRVTNVFNQSLTMLKSTRKASATEDLSLPLHLDPHHANGPRQVSKLLLSRFELDFSSNVEVHPHNRTCQPGPCVCLPDLNRIHIEYRCGPSPEKAPTKVPIWGENYLTHYFKKPGCLREGQMSIFRQLPKRTCGSLAASDDEPTLGWGIYFEEDWHWRSIYFIIVFVIGIGSMVFGVCWSVFEKDIQSAFTITGAWVTLGSLMLGYMAVRTS